MIANRTRSQIKRAMQQPADKHPASTSTEDVQEETPAKKIKVNEEIGEAVAVAGESKEDVKVEEAKTEAPVTRRPNYDPRGLFGMPPEKKRDFEIRYYGAVSNCIQKTHLIHQPESEKVNKEKASIQRAAQSLTSTHLDNIKPRQILERILTSTFPKIAKTIPKFGDITSAHSNFDFRNALTMHRNWKAECVVCMSDDMMGTACGCGHTEIVIFRPCGHAVCMRPCYMDLIRKHPEITRKLSRRTVNVAGTEMVIANSINVNMSVSDTDFHCPTCMSTVESVFQAEEAYGKWTDEQKAIIDADVDFLWSRREIPQ